MSLCTVCILLCDDSHASNYGGRRYVSKSDGVIGAQMRKHLFLEAKYVILKSGEHMYPASACAHC